MARRVAQANAAWTQLERWRSAGETLAYAYLRSGGGLIQTGKAQLCALSSEALTLRAGEVRLLVSLVGAGFELGPQMFFTADFRERFDVEGVGVRLANHDWLFIADSVSPEQLSVGPLVGE